MLNLHPLECTIKDNDHIPDLLLIKYWGIISCKYIVWNTKIDISQLFKYFKTSKDCLHFRLQKKIVGHEVN